MLSCRLRFHSSVSCFGLGLTGRSDGSVGSVTEGSGGGLKYPGAGKKTPGVLMITSGSGTRVFMWTYIVLPPRRLQRKQKNHSALRNGSAKPLLVRQSS